MRASVPSQSLCDFAPWVSAIQTCSLPSTTTPPTTALIDGIQTKLRSGCGPSRPITCSFLPSSVSVLPSRTSGTMVCLGASAPSFGPQKASLWATVSLICATVCGVAMADIHRNQFLAAGADLLDDLFRLRAAELRVDQNCILFAGDQHRADREQCAVAGIVDVQLEGVVGCCRCGSGGAGKDADGGSQRQQRPGNCAKA